MEGTGIIYVKMAKIRIRIQGKLEVYFWHTHTQQSSRVVSQLVEIMIMQTDCSG